MKVLLIVVGVLVGLVVVVDRVLQQWAEGYVADQIVVQADLPGAPEVDIKGFPFLTEAIAGRYDDVRISFDAEQLGQPDGTRADVVLRGAHVPLSDLVSGTVTEIPVDRVDGTATLSYALLSERLGSDLEVEDMVLESDGDGLRLTGTVELLGQEVELTASGQVSLDGDELVLDVQKASGAGVDLGKEILERAAEVLDLRYEVPELPFDLQLTEVRPAAAGVDIRVEGSDTVLRAVE